MPETFLSIPCGEAGLQPQGGTGIECWGGGSLCWDVAFSQLEMI